MMKLCTRCKGTFAGGYFCPVCGLSQRLTDFAGGESAKHLGDSELNRAVQAHYAERWGMVWSILAFFVGFLVSAALARSAFARAGFPRVALFGVAALALLSGVWIGIRIGIGMASRAAGASRYVCPDEDAEASLQKHSPRGSRWLEW